MPGLCLLVRAILFGLPGSSPLALSRDEVRGRVLLRRGEGAGEDGAGILGTGVPARTQTPAKQVIIVITLMVKPEILEHDNTKITTIRIMTTKATVIVVTQSVYPTIEMENLNKSTHNHPRSC